MNDVKIRKHEFNVDKIHAGKRLDVFLTEMLPGLSRTRIQNLCKNDGVLLNGKIVSANYRLSGDEQILVVEPETVAVGLAAENIPLQIIYEDEHIIVINKAPGMVVHPAAGNWSGTLVNALMAKIVDIQGIGGELRPGIVHRLDKDTSGLMVVAKNDVAHKLLTADLAARKVSRRYLAVVKGMLVESHGVIRAPIGRHPKDRKKMAVVDKNGKFAETEFIVKTRYRDFTLVECSLKTGRTHQIRVHLSYIGHPLVGDAVYGIQRNRFGFLRQALHAYQLAFDHPVTGEKLCFTTEVWPDMAELLKMMEPLQI